MFLYYHYIYYDLFSVHKLLGTLKIVKPLSAKIWHETKKGSSPLADLYHHFII